MFHLLDRKVKNQTEPPLNVFIDSPGVSLYRNRQRLGRFGLTADWPHRPVFGLIMLAVVSFACSYMLEIYTHQPWRMPFGQQLFNAAFYLLLLLFWLGVTGHGLGAAIATCAMSLLIGYANFVVVTFRDTPILPWDLLSMQTALSVSANYKMPVPQCWWFVFLLAIFVIVVAVSTKVRLTLAKPRLLLALCSLILLFSYAGVLQSHRFTSFFYFNETLFTPDYLYMQNGFVPSFLMNLRYLRVEEPKGYSIDEVEELATVISEMASDDVAHDSGSLADWPNLIVVMNESFADLSVLSSFTTQEDYMPFFRSLSDNAIRGDLYVSVIGGNTATTEFEFLTGDSMAFLPVGSVAYQQYIHADHPSLPTAMKELGYRTIAMHPYGADGWDRDEVYDRLNFDEALFIDDFTHLEYIRHYVSDRSVYRQLIDAFEQKEPDDRLFCFTVTMQNHGGYEIAYDNFTPTMQILDVDCDDACADDGCDFTLTEKYLSLVRESDDALAELVDYFSLADERTVILFFGDHQPHDQAVAGLMAQNKYGHSELEMAQNRLIVPFVIWANYDIAENNDVAVSTNFLSSLLLETAGLPQTAYGYFLSDLYKEIPVMTAAWYMDASGRRIRYEDAEPGHQAHFAEYEILQYNHLFDLPNRLNTIFQPLYQAN
ncbi:MAG: LTA synthase family protein [Bacillota bacterium]|nr:LTA synthase family protein [Bacillota bacterium]